MRFKIPYFTKRELVILRKIRSFGEQFLNNKKVCN